MEASLSDDPRGVTTIVFDVDGTLYPQAPLRRSMLLRLVREAICRPLQAISTVRALGAYRRAQELLRGIPVRGGLAEAQLRVAAELSGQREADIAAVVARWMEKAPLALLEGLVPPALSELLDEARARGMRLGILSDYPAAEKLRAMRLASFFDVVVTAQDPAVNRFKPDPSGLVEALRRLGATPDEALYVGDRIDVDVLLARATGVRCAIIGHGAPVPRSSRGEGATGSARSGAPEWLQVADFGALHAALFDGDLAVGRMPTSGPVPVAPRPSSRHPAPKPAVRPTLRGQLAIMRVDHWFKNVFVIPGIIAAIRIDPWRPTPRAFLDLALGLLSVCLVASSNYVLNEVLDGPSDRAHPVKHARPVPSGSVSIPLAYVQWIVLMGLGVGLAWHLSGRLALTVAALWGMGCIYNIPPIRSKDLPYVDVLSEAANNPLRLLAGWFLVSTTSIAPVSLLLSYWMIGCYFMAMKRFAEYREIGDRRRAAAYRRSFAHYTSDRLLVSVMFYGSSAMLFLGAFIMRYRLELILSFPLIAFVMATYLLIALGPDSAVQRPEGLYREPALMAAVFACAMAMAALMVVDIPALPRIFTPTAPTIASEHAQAHNTAVPP